MKLSRLLNKASVFSFLIFIALNCSAFAGSLHDAAKSGDIPQTKRLIDQGADVNAGDQYGATPLYWAAFKGYADIAKLLIANGVNPIFS